MLNWRDPRSPTAGGAERVTEAYLRGLVERGHEVVWFSHRFAGAALEETYAGIRIVRRGGIVTSPLQAPLWYRSERPFDLVIDQHHGLPWYAPWWCRTRCIAYLHEVLGPIWNAFYRRPWSLLGQTQERVNYWLYRNIPFWTPSQSTANDLKARGVRNITVIPNGTDIQALPELEPKPLTEPLRLAVVSRLAPNKRVDHAIEVLAILRQRGIDARLTIIGSGGEETRLRQLVSDRNLEPFCELTGYLPEEKKNELLACSHWLLHTSVREGWGLNVLEANAMGTPAAAYPVAGLIDSTRDDETGVVASRESPEALADRLGSFLTRPETYPPLRHNAWELAKSLHWDRVLPTACDWLEQQATPSLTSDMASRVTRGG